MKKIIGILKTFIANIPYAYLKIVGGALGLIAYAADKRHRMIIKRNLRFIFPDLSRNHVNSLSRQIFINTTITFLEIFQLTCSSNNHLNQKVRILDPGNNAELLRNHKKLILISAHMGNWEVPNLFISKYLKKPIVSVVRPLDSETLNHLMLEFRGRHGSKVINKKGALQKLARALRDDQTIGMLIDQDIRPEEAVKVNFLGKSVNSTPSVAWLAGRYNCPVLPIFCVREPNGKLVVEIKPPLQLMKSNNPKDDLLINTQIINDSISNAIREHVDQWFWFHKRWKRYYPDLYPEENKRLNRLEKKNIKKKKQRVR